MFDLPELPLSYFHQNEVPELHLFNKLISGIARAEAMLPLVCSMQNTCKQRMPGNKMQLLEHMPMHAAA